MKVVSTSGAAGASGPTRSSRPAAGNFAPESAPSARESASASAPSAVGALGSLDALLALQEAPNPMERRKRAIRRAGGLLDALDQVKLALLDEGTDPAAALDRLRRMAHDARDGTDDPGLELVLDEVDVRTEVELAKEEMRRRAA